MNIHVDTPQFKYSFTLSDTSLIVNDGGMFASFQSHLQMLILHYYTRIPSTRCATPLGPRESL